MARSERLNSRQKGASGERELAHFLTERGFPARRAQQYKGTAESMDLECELLAMYLHECKRSKRISDLYKWLCQAEKEAEEHRLVPLIWHRRDREKWQLTMWAEDFLQLRLEIQEQEETEHALRERIEQLESLLNSTTKGRDDGTQRQTRQGPEEIHAGEDSA